MQDMANIIFCDMGIIASLAESAQSASHEYGARLMFTIYIYNGDYDYVGNCYGCNIYGRFVEAICELQ